MRNLTRENNTPPAPATLLPDERVSHHEANGLRLCVREWGAPDAPPIVLLHGLRGFSGTWREVARALSPTYRLIALDQRGRGDSDWDPGCNYYTDAYLADLETVADQLQLTQFILLGHSMGGATAYVYAAQHPERLRGLVIEDVAPGSSTGGAGAERIVREMAALPTHFETWAAARDYWRSARPTVGEAALEQRVAESLREDASGQIIWRYDAAGISRTRVNPEPSRVVDLWPAVDALRTPTLVIRGERSDFCALATVQEMMRRNPMISSVSVPGASHYVHDDAPDLFIQHFRRFLERAPALATAPGPNP